MTMTRPLPRPSHPNEEEENTRSGETGLNILLGTCFTWVEIYPLLSGALECIRPDVAISGQISAVIFSSHFFVRSLRYYIHPRGSLGNSFVYKSPPRPLLIIAIRYARERRKFDMDEIHEKFPRNGKDTDGRFSRFINSLQLSS